MENLDTSLNIVEGAVGRFVAEKTQYSSTIVPFISK
jgi:hypothetical protein